MLWAQVASTVGELLNVVTFVDSLLLVALLGLSLWRLGVRTPPGMRQA